MVASSFPSALAFTLKYEGGKSNDLHDPGGRTNEGVTQATYDSYRGEKVWYKQDVFKMTDAERDDIYKHGYWDKITGDSLPAGVDLCVFDYAVNSGPSRALRTYASMGHGKEPQDAVHRICSSRLSFLRALSTWSFFGSGWMKRVAACEARSIELAGASLSESHNRIKGAGNGFVSLFVMFASGAGIIISKIIHTLPWWGISIIICVAALYIFKFFHHAAVTKVRLNTLSDASNKAETLKLAIAKMSAASSKLAHGGK